MPRNFNNRNHNNNHSKSDSGTSKDENQPEEDDEMRAYRQQIETQRRKREEILRQKEARRRQLMEQKVKEKEPEDVRLQPIVVTEKKILLKKPRLDDRSPEKSTTPPIAVQEISPSKPAATRRIVLKPSNVTKERQAMVKTSSS